MVYSRKFKHEKEDLLEEGKRIIASDGDAKFIFRVSMVNLILSGIRASELSEYCGVDERTLIGWVTKADTSGFESLRAVKQTGRPSKLTDEQKEKIKFAISGDPSLEGYPNWDGPSLSDFIRREYGVEYSVRASQKLFHELGFSLIRPQAYPSKDEPNEESRKEFKRRMAETSADPGRIVVFQDEAHFTVQATITRGWAPKGSEPKVKSYPGRQKVSFSGFVIPDDGRLWVDRPERFDYGTTIASIRGFLEANAPPEGKRYCIVMDNAPWHKKAMRLIAENEGGRYDDIVGRADIVALPPYSPDLNPIEQVWRVTRKERTHNRFFRSIGALTSTLDAFFDGLSKPNEKLHTLCSFRGMIRGGASS